MASLRYSLALLGTLFFCSAAYAHHDDLHEIIDDEFRSVEAKARDGYRHPYETLSFFGLKPDMTVVELWPGGGWYSDVIAPYVAKDGQFIAAHFNPETQHPFAEFFRESLRVYKSKVEANPEWYGEILVEAFEPPITDPIADASSVDMVLTFRNVHNWLKDGSFNEVVRQVRRMLKPGGVFGVVDHRARFADSIDATADNGYVNQQWLIKRIEAIGFQMVVSSPVNANLGDSTDHPNGVWTLPPNLRVPEGESEKKYLDIGESDRFTLKFVKLGR